LKYWKAVFSILGLGALTLLVHDYGFDRLRHELFNAGWLTLPLLLTFVPTLLCYSVAWQLCTDSPTIALTPRYFRFTVISIAWNNLSPFLKILGEPIKVSLLSRHIDTKHALRSVVIYNMVHLIGTVAAFLVAALLIPPIFDPAHGVKVACYSSVGLFILIVILLIWLPKFLHRQMARRSFKRLRAANLWIRWSFRSISRFYAEKKAAFIIAVVIEVLARFIEGVTFYVAFQIVRQPMPLLNAAFLEVSRALFDNLFFFIPYQVGSREFGISVFLESVLKAPKGAFVAAALLYRLVEIAWMAIGYALWVKSGLRRKL
jgi:hypothetical protein